MILGGAFFVFLQDFTPIFGVRGFAAAFVQDAQLLWRYFPSGLLLTFRLWSLYA